MRFSIRARLNLYILRLTLLTASFRGSDFLVRRSLGAARISDHIITAALIDFQNRAGDMLDAAVYVEVVGHEHTFLVHLHGPRITQV